VIGLATKRTSLTVLGSVTLATHLGWVAQTEGFHCCISISSAPLAMSCRHNADTMMVHPKCAEPSLDGEQSKIFGRRSSIVDQDLPHAHIHFLKNDRVSRVAWTTRKCAWCVDHANVSDASAGLVMLLSPFTPDRSALQLSPRQASFAAATIHTAPLHGHEPS
jgi:hypothetical protein